MIIFIISLELLIMALTAIKLYIEACDEEDEKYSKILRKTIDENKL